MESSGTLQTADSIRDEDKEEEKESHVPALVLHSRPTDHDEALMAR